MSYKVTEENNISTVYLDSEIDMDKTEGAKEVIMPLIEAKGSAFKLKRCAIHGFIRHFRFN